jgi:hypothetical protein
VSAADITARSSLASLHDEILALGAVAASVEPETRLASADDNADYRRAGAGGRERGRHHRA